jgi:hypothetical protein
MMVHSLCSSYHWTYDQAMKMTLPQIILLNHAASVVGERTSRRYKKIGGSTVSEDDNLALDPAVWRGKKLSQLNTAETAQYLDGFFD